MKLCFAASSGGHLEEIMCLHNIVCNHESFLLTEKNELGLNGKWKNVWFVEQINRKEKGAAVKLIKNFIISFRVLHREKPDCIISTGALAAFPICLIGKIMRKKIIYIESFARVDKPSLTGRYMKYIADLFLVQWPEMLEFYPRAEYVGRIF
ncbi:PssD/Cps14F family polysaccharide biosynthesis glycosyltransferase [Murimonas intestini]|uniref:Oligosaccharide biosynthesis protein Alg14 n=1 Tax=Murimonas intestini TaxID=1337051 RepID=A0AB73T807_9FIRM|nr:PssD/Cps14F family polysaccharide biosynthesis glycosyltransferase [Murimonas intestini]MCR1839797.1 UDP-N-acetylglucosamine transferase subunit ALG14 [Murimonas intestini]MCR1866639.1 UDP-N-acetylglucosamine transferase subunit ALG14 [Murimonas intestini]MCR1884737.1 UDP-N-acetylglucosamine transferase subunit ALG14 [Murimonas intestini]